MYIESVLKRYTIFIDGMEIADFSVNGALRCINFLLADTDERAGQWISISRDDVATADWDDDDGSMDRDTAWYMMRDTSGNLYRVKFYKNLSLEAMRELKHELWEWD